MYRLLLVNFHAITNLFSVICQETFIVLICGFLLHVEYCKLIMPRLHQFTESTTNKQQVIIRGQRLRVYFPQIFWNLSGVQLFFFPRGFEHRQSAWLTWWLLLKTVRLWFKKDKLLSWYWHVSQFLPLTSLSG